LAAVFLCDESAMLIDKYIDPQKNLWYILTILYERGAVFYGQNCSGHPCDHQGEGHPDD
jgi:hypothetical protein